MNKLTRLNRMLLSAAPPILAAGIQTLVWHWISPYIWFFFYPAVFFSSWIGGKRGGLVGTLLSVLFAWFIFVPTVPNRTVVDGIAPVRLVSIVLFICMGTLFSVFHERLMLANQSLSDALDAVQAANEQLEIRVDERTVELKQTLDQLRESHATIDAALASMSDAVFISDCEGNFTEFNDAFATFHRFASKEECLTKLAEYPDRIQVFFADGTEAPLDMWAVPRALRGETVTNAEYILRRRDTGESWIGNYNFSPIRDKDGEIIGSVVVGRDVTEAKREEEEIRNLNAKLEVGLDERTRQLEELNKQLSAFTYSVSHDLRSPLRHLMGFSDMLLRASGDQLSEKCQRYVRTIHSVSREMSQLIDDLLALSHTSRVEMQVRWVRLDEMVQEIIRSLEVETAHRDIYWKVGPLPQVEGDPPLLRQVLTNLLGNAVKYTATREHAEIEIGTHGEEDGRVVIFVKDNGVGFDMQYAGRLFSVFQRLHRSDEFKGTGIGLAIVRNIIGRHGGRTWAEAELERGATFYFTLRQVDYSRVENPARVI